MPRTITTRSFFPWIRASSAAARRAARLGRDPSTPTTIGPSFLIAGLRSLRRRRHERVLPPREHLADRVPELGRVARLADVRVREPAPEVVLVEHVRRVQHDPYPAAQREQLP